MLIQLRVTRKSNAEILGCKQDSICDIDLEDYVCGVVASEIGEAPIEACKAQAVAARTNALAYYKLNKPISDASTSAQAFRAERMRSILYPTADIATEETAGEVLKYEGMICSPCSFSHSNGGHTTSSEERWGGRRPWLISQPDPWDTSTKKAGHGVGMSQVGAINAAKQGKNYTDILNFYYQGTTIYEVGDVMPNISASMLVAEFMYALDNKFGYIYGQSGAMWTAAKQKALTTSKANDENYKYSIKYGNQWVGHNVTDCSGLFVYAFRKHGGTIYHSSQAIWDKSCSVKGKLNGNDRDDGKALLPGTAVFRYKAGIYHPYHHIGLYIGGGRVIEAKGTQSGVIESSITTWTHWGELKGVAYGNTYGNTINDTNEKIEVKVMNEQMEVYAESGSTVRLRSAPSTSSEVLMNIPIGSIVTAIGVSGDYHQITYGDKYGFMMSKFLRPAIKNAADSGDNKSLDESTISITLPKTAAVSLAAAIKAAGIQV